MSSAVATATAIQFMILLGLANYLVMASMPKTVLKKCNAPTGPYNTYVFGLLATSGLCYYIFLGALYFGLANDWLVATSYSLVPWVLLKGSNLLRKKATKVGYPVKSDIFPLIYALATAGACCWARNSAYAGKLATGFAYLLVVSGISAVIAPSSLCQAWGTSLNELLNKEPILLTSLRSHGIGLVRTGSVVIAVGNYGMPVARAFGYSSFLTLAMMVLPRADAQGKKLSNVIWFFAILHLILIAAALLFE